MRTGRAETLAMICLLLCVSEIRCNAQECGDNPMQQMLLVAKRTGRTLDHVLTILRDIDSPAYKTLSQKFRHYASCVGLVDTGYFRKRSTPTKPASGILDDDGERVNAGGASLAQSMDMGVGPAVDHQVGATMRLAAQEIKNLQALLDKVYKVKEEIDRVREHLVQAEQEEQECEHGAENCPVLPTTTAADVFLNWLDSYRNDPQQEHQ